MNKPNVPKDKHICAQDGQIHIMPPKSQIERPIAKPRRSTVIKNPVQLPTSVNISDLPQSSPNSVEVLPSRPKIQNPVIEEVFSDNLGKYLCT